MSNDNPHGEFDFLTFVLQRAREREARELDRIMEDCQAEKEREGRKNEST